MLYKCTHMIIQHVLRGRPLAVMTWPTFGLFVQNSLWNSFTLCFYSWCIKWSTRDRKAVLHFGGHSSYIKDSLDSPLYQGLTTDRFGSFSPKSYDTHGPTIQITLFSEFSFDMLYWWSQSWEQWLWPSPSSQGTIKIENIGQRRKLEKPLRRKLVVNVLKLCVKKRKAQRNHAVLTGTPSWLLKLGMKSNLCGFDWVLTPFNWTGYLPPNHETDLFKSFKSLTCPEMSKNVSFFGKFQVRFGRAEMS